MDQVVKRKPATRRTPSPSRLDASAWVDCALEVLADRGIDGVRVEVLAKRLGVTKGSFYWHFKDRDALLQEMLQAWRKRATLGIIERLESTHEPAADRLRRLLRLQFDAKRAEFGADIELSVRLWGRHDAKAARALQEIDEIRLRYIGRLLEEIGVPKREASARAVLVYSYMRVSRSLAVLIPDHSIVESCEFILTRRTE